MASKIFWVLVIILVIFAGLVVSFGFSEETGVGSLFDSIVAKFVSEPAAGSQEGGAALSSDSAADGGQTLQPPLNNNASEAPIDASLGLQQTPVVQGEVYEAPGDTSQAPSVQTPNTTEAEVIPVNPEFAGTSNNTQSAQGQSTVSGAAPAPGQGIQDQIVYWGTWVTNTLHRISTNNASKVREIEMQSAGSPSLIPYSGISLANTAGRLTIGLLCSLFPALIIWLVIGRKVYKNLKGLFTMLATWLFIAGFGITSSTVLHTSAQAGNLTSTLSSADALTSRPSSIMLFVQNLYPGLAEIYPAIILAVVLVMIAATVGGKSIGSIPNRYLASVPFLIAAFVLPTQLGAAIVSSWPDFFRIPIEFLGLIFALNNLTSKVAAVGITLMWFSFWKHGRNDEQNGMGIEK